MKIGNFITRSIQRSIIFGKIEKQKMQNEAAAQFMIKQQNKQSTLENKSASREMARKSKGRSATYRDEDDLER